MQNYGIFCQLRGKLAIILLLPLNGGEIQCIGRILSPQPGVCVVTE